MLGLAVFFYLFVAICSVVIAVCVYAYALHALCTCCTYLPCVWGKPTKGVRAIDSFRVNGW